MSNPCGVNANCSSSGNSYICDCYPEYTGTECDVELDPCVFNPCENEGSCTKITPTEFSCQCSEGYTGEVCSVNIDDCEDVSCGKGTCVDELNGYDCECDPFPIVDFTVDIVEGKSNISKVNSGSFCV